jgi:integrase
LGEIDRRTIALLLAEIEQQSGPVARNRTRSSLSTFFTFAVKEGLIDINPVTATGKASEGPSRDRVLTEAELARLYAVLADDTFSDITKLLVLTAQRRTEIGSLKWNEVDLDRGLIVLGPDRSKNNRQHTLPISTQVKAILERQPRQNEWVFGRNFTSWSIYKAKLDTKLNGIAPFCLHDIRRTATTMMAERLQVLPHILEAILNHVSGHKSGVAGIYNRAKYQDEMRGALQSWADYVDSLRQVKLHN